MGLRAVATGAPLQGYLPPGPIFGIHVTEPQVHDGTSSDATDPEDLSKKTTPEETRTGGGMPSSPRGSVSFRPWCL